MSQEEDTSRKFSKNNNMQKRLVAHIIKINTLLKGEYVRQEGWQPNFVRTNNKTVSRVNLIGVVIDINSDKKSFSIDDGSANIQIMSFEEIKQISQIKIGDIIKVIGRPREFNNNKYVVPEIIKKIENKKWIEYRNKKLKLIQNKSSSKLNHPKPLSKNKDENPQNKKPTKENNDTNATKSGEKIQKIYKLVKELDKGDGADIDDVIEKFGSGSAEEIVNNLLREGEIFEIKTGRLKVLE
ncbi:MAG: hypothetical protein MAG795_01049 [Candidatus Woesearchaeota archaeon]|nr:hypothetical protein [Candidatus Woesearchaeota archaeon]